MEIRKNMCLMNYYPAYQIYLGDVPVYMDVRDFFREKVREIRFIIMSGKLAHLRVLIWKGIGFKLVMRMGGG